MCRRYGKKECSRGSYQHSFLSNWKNICKPNIWGHISVYVYVISVRLKLKICNFSFLLIVSFTLNKKQINLPYVCIETCFQRRLLWGEKCQGNLLSVANNDIITELGMPGKVTKQFAHLSVLIDLIHSLHHNQEIKELRDTALQNTTENGQPGSIAMMNDQGFIKLFFVEDFQVQ